MKKKLRAFVKADIIEQGTSFFTYQAVQDNIFDKVFRGVYQEEIDGFEPEKIKDEYKELYKKLEGAHNKLKGDFAEYFIIKNLRYKAYKQNSLYVSMMHNLPEDFKFVPYPSIWSYTASPIYQKDIQIDVLARAQEDDEYTLIGEVKNRKKKFSLKEAKEFFAKAKEVQKLENIHKAMFFVFSISGFYKNTIEFFKDNEIAWSYDERFME